MASERRTLYVGVTSNIHGRVWQHKYDAPPKSFAGRYACTRLVFFGEFARMDDAIAYEKYVKGKVRAFNVRLIEQQNPDWNDLAADWYDSPTSF
jgi:putative endonuclease